MPERGSDTPPSPRAPDVRDAANVGRLSAVDRQSPKSCANFIARFVSPSKAILPEVHAFMGSNW